MPRHPAPATGSATALAPAEVAKVVLDEDTRRIEVVVPDDQLSLAIGRRGQNVRLASQLTGWQIDILTEAEESERRQAQFKTRTNLFMTVLDADETLAQLLASEGFNSVEEVAYVELDDLAGISGLDEDTAQEIQARAVAYLEKQNSMFEEKRRSLGVADEVANVEGVSPQILVALGENGVKTLDDLAGCATDDLTGWTETVNGERKRFAGFLDGLGVDEDAANAIIMAARRAAGWIKDEPEAEIGEADGAEEAEASA
jgi:N utilization substance protein A